MKHRILFFLLLLLTGTFLSFSLFDYKIIFLINSFFETNLNREFWGFGMQHFGIELAVMGAVLLLGMFLPDRRRFLFYTAATIALFFVFLFQFSVNIPITDDYRAFLGFSNKYFFADGFSEKINLLFSFYDESRIIVIRSFLVFLHFITGEVNFKTLILFGNCCLPFILILFYKSITSEKYRWEILLILAVLLFHFGYYDAVVWVFPAVNYKLIILFLMISLFCVKMESAWWQSGAVICSIAAVLTTGNGWLVFPVLMLYFFVERKWKLFFIWVLIGGVFAIFYFNSFSFSRQGISSFSLTDYFVFSCCFLGSAFQFLYKLHMPFVAGILIWLFFVILTFKKYYRKNFPVYGLMMFVIFSSLMAATFRMDTGGVRESLSNRYGFYSLIVVSASLIALFEILNENKHKVLFPVLFFFSIAYHMVAGIFFFPEVPVRKDKLEKFIGDIKNNRPFRKTDPIIPEQADIIVKEAMDNKIYFP